MTPSPITAEEVRAEQNKRGCGIMEARRHVVRKKAKEMADRAQTVEDVKAIMLLMLNEGLI